MAVGHSTSERFDSIHFTPDEMGMLLGLKDNDIFNKVVVDVKHNSIAKALTLMVAQRCRHA